MKAKLKPYIGLFLKIFLPAYLLFVLITFPTNDIKHKITEQIAIATKNQVQIQFDELKIGLIPSPALIFKDTDIYLRNRNPLNAQSLKISPSILSLLSLNYGASLAAEGIFSGDAEAHFKDRGEGNKNTLNISASNIQLSELLGFLRQRLNAKSKINLDLQTEYDPTFKEGIDGQLAVTTPSLNMKELTLATDFGPIKIPNLNIKSIRFLLEMNQNRWVIKEAKIGEDGDSIFGNISGNANVRLMTTPAGPRLSNLSYDLSLRLNVERKFVDQLAFKAILDNYLTNANAKYHALNLKLNAASLRSPPKITKIR